MATDLIDPAAILETSTTALLPFNEVSVREAFEESKYAVFTNFDERFPDICAAVKSSEIV